MDPNKWDLNVFKNKKSHKSTSRKYVQGLSKHKSRGRKNKRKFVYVLKILNIYIKNPLTIKNQATEWRKCLQ